MKIQFGFRHSKIKKLMKLLHGYVDGEIYKLSEGFGNCQHTTVVLT